MDATFGIWISSTCWLFLGVCSCSLAARAAAAAARVVIGVFPDFPVGGVRIMGTLRQRLRVLELLLGGGGSSVSMGTAEGSSCCFSSPLAFVSDSIAFYLKLESVYFLVPRVIFIPLQRVGLN